jgi:3-carboxy-cis,cis-muconate cycloisomerase
VQDYDRDWQGHFETIVVPQAFLVTHAGVKQMGHILRGLKVFPERMRANIDVTKGLAMAESVMMALAPKVGRTRAHELVAGSCNTALDNDVRLRDVLLEDRHIREHLEPAAIDTALDPRNYIGAAEQTVDQVLREVGAV